MFPPGRGSLVNYVNSVYFSYFYFPELIWDHKIPKDYKIEIIYLFLCVVKIEDLLDDMHRQTWQASAICISVKRIEPEGVVLTELLVTYNSH